MDNHIPHTFDNFTQRQLARGLETKSETNYKGYVILLRAYAMSGITAIIIKEVEVEPGKIKRYKLRSRSWNFYKPLDLLNLMKTYINNHEDNLIRKFDELKAKK